MCLESLMGMGEVDAGEINKGPVCHMNAFTLYIKWLDSFELVSDMNCYIFLKQFSLA